LEIRPAFLYERFQLTEKTFSDTSKQLIILRKPLGEKVSALFKEIFVVEMFRLIKNPGQRRFSKHNRESVLDLFMLQLSKVFAKNDYPTLLLMVLPLAAFVLITFFNPVHLLALIGAFALTATGYHLAALWFAQREAEQIALLRQQLITRWRSREEIGH
jgi:hypothetical protein